jgi:hypothetical protein
MAEARKTAAQADVALRTRFVSWLNVLAAVALLTATSAAGRGPAPVPGAGAGQEMPLDRLGDPLPQGALARLGTTTWSTPWPSPARNTYYPFAVTGTTRAG